MATFVIVDHDDPRFPGWVCIEAHEDDGTVSSRSWAPPDVDPAVRIGPEMPVAVDKRTDTDTDEIAYRVPSCDEYRSLCGVKRRDYNDSDPGEPGKDHHRAVAAYAAVLEVVSVKDAAAACEHTEADLVAEAEAWAVVAEVKAKGRR